MRTEQVGYYLMPPTAETCEGNKVSPGTRVATATPILTWLVAVCQILVCSPEPWQHWPYSPTVELRGVESVTSHTRSVLSSRAVKSWDFHDNHRTGAGPREEV